MRGERRVVGAGLVLSVVAGGACGQLILNEVSENPVGPAGQNDSVLEYIEIYGPPGFDLTGYAVGLFKGGQDPDGDDVPGELGLPISTDSIPEIDEAFSLDGLTVGSNGMLVLYNGTDGPGGTALIPLVLPAATNGDSFIDKHIPAPDGPGNLNNDGSSTYLLVRARPDYSIDAMGNSVYGANYTMAKDTNPDVDFDGKLDFGDELPVPPLPFASVPVDPLQIVDEIAWSNAGGKEYVRTSQNEISDTPGFNPDCVSRVNYFIENPMLGLRMNSEGETVPSRIADESWVYGELTALFDYDSALAGGPTDPNGDGFQDIDLTGFVLTPGDFNDQPGLGITQFRFTPGDVTFDGVVNLDDFGFALDNLGAGLDDMGTVDEREGVFLYETSSFNSLLTVIRMDLTDGTTGEWNSGVTVTQSDIDALRALLPNDPDLDGDGRFDVDDAYLATQSPVDLDADGDADLDDAQHLISFLRRNEEADVTANRRRGLQ